MIVNFLYKFLVPLGGGQDRQDKGGHSLGCGSNLMYIIGKNTTYGSEIQTRTSRQHKHHADYKTRGQHA
jgi:hypothetical protein